MNQTPKMVIVFGKVLNRFAHLRLAISEGWESENKTVKTLSDGRVVTVGVDSPFEVFVKENNRS